MDSQPICPYCKRVLAKAPGRKAKCPMCARDIYVRSRQTIFPVSLLTEQEALSADFVSDLGLSRSDFSRMSIFLKQRAGCEPAPAQVAWELAKCQAQRSSAPWIIYYQMGLFMCRLRQDHRPALEKAAQAFLLDLQQQPSGPYRVEISDAGDDSCPACRAQSGRVLSVEEALRLMPIPCKDCTTEFYDGGPGFCRCLYNVHTG